MSVTPEMLERAKKMREALKANPALADDMIATLSAAAQGPAKQMKELFMGDISDPAATKAAIDKIKAGLPDAIKAELEAHKHALTDKVGLPRMDV